MGPLRIMNAKKRTMIYSFYCLCVFFKLRSYFSKTALVTKRPLKLCILYPLPGFLIHFTEEDEHFQSVFSNCLSILTPYAIVRNSQQLQIHLSI